MRILADTLFCVNELQEYDRSSNILVSGFSHDSKGKIISFSPAQGVVQREYSSECKQRCS